MNDPIGAKVFAPHDDGGTGNPDPTMNPSDKSPKGENMPPAGGESISPADSERPSRPNDHGAAPGDEDDAPA